MEDMKFYSLLDFYPRRDAIKSCYDLLSAEEIRIYKMYVYSLPWMEDDVKDLIWEYFNDWSLQVWSDLAIKYRTFIERNEKRQQKYDEEERKRNEMQYYIKTR